MIIYSPLTGVDDYLVLLDAAITLLYCDVKTTELYVPRMRKSDKQEIVLKTLLYMDNDVDHFYRLSFLDISADVQ